MFGECPSRELKGGVGRERERGFIDNQEVTEGR